VLSLCGLALLSGCATTSGSQPDPTPTPKPAPPALEKPTYTVQQGTVVDEIKVSGHVAPVQQQDLTFTQDGHLKTLYVDRTSVITEGQLLAELDLGELPNQLRQAQVAYEQAKLVLDQARTQQEFAVRKAQLDLDQARAGLAALQTPPKPAELQEAQAAVKAAQATLDATRNTASATKTNAKLQLDQASQALIQAQTVFAAASRDWEKVRNNENDIRYHSYHDQFVKSEAELHSAEAAVAQAQLAYDTAQKNEGPTIAQAESRLADAQAKLAALTSGPDPNDVADARRAISRATLELEQAQQGVDPEAEKRVATAQLDVERIQSQIDAGRLYAPFDGKVATITMRPGDAVAAYKPVMSVMNESALEILVSIISAQDATRIGVGQPVQITFSSYSGKTFQGEISSLPTSMTSSSSSVNPDTSYHIKFDAPDTALEVGDLAEVTITLAKKENTLWLPPQAVRAFEGRRFVVVQDGERQRRQDIKVGIVSADRVEILEGLQAGDVVVGQ
jgi:HlyD family secretion protein